MEQGKVTFTASGPGSDASGTVLVVDGVGYKYSDLPVSFTWDVGSKHTFEWKSTIGAGSGKRYVWISTSGLSSARSGTITVPSGGGSVSASYKKQYYLTMQASPSEGGSVSPSSGWHDAGSKVTISASPSSGYRFDRWVGSGSGSYTGASSSARITMNAPITETAYFVKTGTVTFSASGLSSDASGTVLVVDGTSYTYSDLPVSFTWDAGTKHTFEWKSPVSAASGKRYVWTSTSGLSTRRSGTITVPNNGGTVSASYKTQYKLTVQSGSGGTTSPSPGSYWYDSGKKVTVTAKPNAGYGFNYWRLDGKNVGSRSSYTVTMTSPHTIKAYFIKRSYTVTFSADGLGSDASGTVLVVDGRSYSVSSLPKTFTWTMGTSHSFEWKTPVSAGTGKRYVWTSTSGLSASRKGTITVPVGGGEVKARYKTQYRLKIEVSPVNAESYGVSTNPSPGERWYDAGSKVKVTAVNNAPFKVTLQADTTTSGISLSLSKTSGTPRYTSTLTVKVGSKVSSGSHKIQVTGFEYGWKFRKWILDGKSSGASSSITVTMNAPHTVEADFYAPHAKVTLSKSSLTISRGGSARITVTVDETSSAGQNIKTLTVTVPSSVTVTVKDYKGKALSGVTVTIGGQSKRTDRYGRAVFTVQPGKYTITVPSSVGGRSFYRWSDGKKGTSRTETISGDASFMATYKALVEITNFKVDLIASVFWVDVVASGQVVYGDPEPIKGATVKVVYHFYSWTGPFTGTLTDTTDRHGKFKTTFRVMNPIPGVQFIAIQYVEAWVTSPDYYKSNTAFYGKDEAWFPVTFTQNDLPAGTKWSVTLAGYTKEGTGRSITIYAPEGKHSWSVDPVIDGDVRYVGSPSSGSVTVNGKETVTVRFSKEYKLTMKVSGLGSTEPAEGVHWVKAGSKVTIKAHPAGDHRFSKWQGSGSGSYSGSRNPATITMKEPITETAFFTKQALVLFDSTIGSDASGTVLVVDGKSYSASSLPKTFRWDVGSKHSFEWKSIVSAGSGKRYVWTSSSGLSTKRKGTITVPNNGGSITSYYKTQYALTVTVSPSGAGTTSPSGTRWYDAGSTVTVSASPSSRFKTSLSISGLPRGASASFNPSSGTHSFTSTLKISTSRWTPSGSYTITVKGSKSGYNFDCWKLDNRWVSSSSRYTVYMNGPHTLTAIFTQPKIKVDAQASSVNVEPGKSTSVSVKVSTSSYDDTSDAFTLKVLKYVTITIKVQDVHRGTAISGVTVSVDGVSKRTDRYGRASFTVLEGRHTISVPSSAGAGSRGTLPFWKWSDGSTSRSRTVAVSSSKTYTAIYKNILYYSSVDAGKTGSTKFWAKAYVRVKGYSGSQAYASYANVKATWKIWYWYRWWPDYVSASGTADWKGYKYLSKTINEWGVTGIRCTVEASKTGYVSTSWSKTVYSTNWADVTFSASGLSGVSGTVLVVDGNSYRLSDLPKTFTWEAGTKHSFSWTSTFSVSSGTRYAWKSTSGISSSRSATITVPNGGGSIKATYSKQYYLTMKAGTGGSVSPSSGWRDAGSSVTIKATPNSGYVFDRWSGSGSGSYSGTSSTATIRMNAPITETAYFKASTYTVKFSCSGKPSWKKWTVTFNGESKSSYSSTIYFYNVKGGRYSFTVSTIYDGSDTRYYPSPASGTLNVPDTTSKTVTFTKQYRLYMKRNIAGGYTSPSIGEHWYSSGSSVTIRAYTYSDYKFKKWSGSGSGSYTGYSSSATIRMNGPITETAYFEEKASTYTVKFYRSGYIGGESWTVKFNGEKKSTTGSTIYFYNVKPGSYYYYVYTVYDGSTRYKPSPSSGFIKVPDSTSKTITFTKQYRLHMKRSPSSGGTTSPTPGYHWYSSGSRVTIKAKPYSGYKFKKWSGSGSGSYSGTSSTKTITIRGAITETAYFEKSGGGGGGSTTYTVKFRRTGVPGSASWWAKLGGKKKSSTSSIISFTGVKQGTYSWSVDSIIYKSGVWYITTDSSGSVTVNRDKTITIRYVPIY